MSQLSFSDLESDLIETVAEAVAARCDQLATFTDQPGCLTRTFCSPAMQSAHQQISQWMEQAV